MAASLARTGSRPTAEDKIVAVMENGYFCGAMENISELPEIYIERIRHYLSTYKMVPGFESQLVVEGIFDNKHGSKVVAAAVDDHEEASCR